MVYYYTVPVITAEACLEIDILLEPQTYLLSAHHLDLQDGLSCG